MPKPHRPPPLETLRDAIANALWGLNANDLPGACTALGLREGDRNEAMGSKRRYVRSRIASFKGPELMALAQRVIEEHGAPDLADFIAEITTHADHRVTDLTRRAVLNVLDTAGELFGDLPVWDGVAVLSPNLEMPSRQSSRVGATLREDIQQHYIDNPDFSTFQLLELCGALTCSQQRFFDLLEKVVDPVCRQGDAQELLVKALNAELVADGFELTVVGHVSRRAVYGVRRIAAGVAGAPKNLIFASVRTKPDLYFTDAINNDIAIVNKSDALIYDRSLSETGLLWPTLADWWQDKHQLPTQAEASKSLFLRLREAVLEANSPGEAAIFQIYYARFTKTLGERLPALVPQVYLHYDPRSELQRGENRVLVRQRMDFLMLLPHGARIVVEVDGKHHFADGNTASPSRYAEMAAEDRRLRLQGYEVYRFGAAEFHDVQRGENRYQVGADSTQLIESFFEKLFSRHLDHQGRCS